MVHSPRERSGPSQARIPNKRRSTASRSSRNRSPASPRALPRGREDPACKRSIIRRSRGIKNPPDQCQADPKILVLVDTSNYLSSRVARLPRAISALTRCITLVPVRRSRAVLRMPFPLASAERIVASFVSPILRPTDWSAALGAFVSRPGDPCVDPFLNNSALELGKYAQHLEESAPGRGGCVDRLLFEIEVAPGGVEFAKKADEILQRSPRRSTDHAATISSLPPTTSFRSRSNSGRLSLLRWS
jgi:hypothetical protein